MQYALGRITVPNLLLSADEELQQITAYIHCFKMLVIVGEQNTKFWYYFNIVLKWLDHKKQLAKTHASLQTHY